LDFNNTVSHTCVKPWCAYNVIFSVNVTEDLPVVQDNRGAEPQDYSDEVMREMNCEKSIERDEYIQKKKPKGKAKFIGQSKAEKV
jgi:hypothetical protein